MADVLHGLLEDVNIHNYSVSNHTINGATIARALSGSGFGMKTQAVVPLRRDTYQIIAVDIISTQTAVFRN